MTKPVELVALCPYCYGRHSDRRYTCAMTHGWYTCGPCSQRYTSPAYKTEAQIAALDDAAMAKFREFYADRDVNECDGITAASMRLVLLHDEEWEWPK